MAVNTKDWTGNGNSIYMALGASNHTAKEREVNDYYATEPRAAELLLELEKFSHYIWEPACGEGHISKVLEAHGYSVISTDLIARGYGMPDVDFLRCVGIKDGYDIITNPPYKYGMEFVEKALELVGEGQKVAMFLKLQFLEGKTRGKLFEKYPPKTVYVSRGRLLCAKNADFDGMRAGGGSVVAYCWFVWQKGYTGDTVIKWFN